MKKIYGTNAGSTHTGTSDEEHFIVYGGNDTVYALGGNDKIEGGNGHDKLWGGIGNDLLYGNADNDKLYGESGNDFLFGGTGSDTLIGGSGVDFLYGEDGLDVLYGNAHDDWLEGNGNADYLNGGTGNDKLWGGASGDVFIFNAMSGMDTVYDFQNGVDKLDFVGIPGFDDYWDVLAAAIDLPGKLQIDLGGGNYVLVNGMTRAQLTSDDVQFFNYVFT